jgi:hypothetical protein
LHMQLYASIVAGHAANLNHHLAGFGSRVRNLF